jgi:Glycosyltransferase 61
MDADTLVVRNFEDLLDYVLETASVAGVTAHFKFPTWPGISSHESWRSLADELIAAPLDFSHAYSLATADTPEEDRYTPFYVNDGMVLFARSVFPDVVRHYLSLRPKLMDRIPDPYFSGQIALGLAIAETGIRSWALPMRYNFPNDENADRRYPEELEDVHIFHYLRTDKFDRQKIFTNANEYDQFLRSTLSGSNYVFQQYVSKLIGLEYPFVTDEPAADRLGIEIQAPAAARTEIPETTPLPGRDYAEQFEKSGNLEPLKRFKQALVAELGIAAGFDAYKAVLSMPDSEELHVKSLMSQHVFSRTHGDSFCEWAVAGEPFVVEPPVIMGEGAGNGRPLSGVTRSAYVACVRDARVRGRSALIEVQDIALLDYQGSELELFDWEMHIDPAILWASNRYAATISPRASTPSMQIDEGFMLLGPQAGAFGDWMIDYLPRYVAANISGLLPPVPVLIDAGMPEVHRCSLSLMLPEGVETIEIPAYATARVGRLWCAPSLHYAPTREKMDRRFKFDYVCPPPHRIARVTQEIARRVHAAIGDGTGPERVYLSRSRASTWRNLVNSDEIEGVARANGFAIVAPDQFSFLDQVKLLLNARLVIAPEGSALYLAYFVRPGAKLCILNHELVEWAITYGSYLSGSAPQITMLTGPVVRSHHEFPHRADYWIDAQQFCEFLDQWVKTKD